MRHGGGALLSVAARYYDVGRLAGRQAERIPRGGMPQAGLPVARMTEFAILINMETAIAIGALPPIGLLGVAETTN